MLGAKENLEESFSEKLYKALGTTSNGPAMKQKRINTIKVVKTGL